MSKQDADFGGYVTRNDLKCSDGRIIRHNAFKDNDGQTVPLVWNHSHDELEHVLGHVLLENRDDGVYGYGTFNDTSEGQVAKVLVSHKDITALSIYANGLKQIASDVMHGTIREVSLVHAGANPGAYIDTIIAHSADTDEEAVIYTGESIELLFHSDEGNGDASKSGDDGGDSKETVQDVIDTMNEKQKKVLYGLLGSVLSEDDDEDEDDNDEGGSNMKHNIFDQDTQNTENVLTHSDQMDILNLAKTSTVGTFQSALQIYADEHDLQHDAVSSGFVQTGEGNVYNLFPEYKEVRPGAPELITSDQGWISVVMNKVHKSPISRIRTSQVDIRNIDALRAKGYEKGKKKSQTGNFKLVRRTTDPQTVYVKSALHRDDIIDITDFDYVQYLYNIDRMMLNEELATAIMLGDGRDDGDEGKIASEHIRPIWLDDELYTIHVDLDVAAAKAELQGTNTGANFGENYIYAEAIITKVLYAREKYKGTGTPDFYCTPHLLNVMLLARDINGRRIYSSKAELASALNVGNIVTAEQFEGKTRTTEDSKTKKLLGIIANLADYSLGATKGGEVTHFTQFDIDFNQEKSLIETRCSGALTRVYSAIALEEDVTASA
jgi:HK97 family phage prohead protease